MVPAATPHTPTMPVLYLPHGGGPLPLLGDPAHQSLVEFISQLGPQLPHPQALLVISAHWETPQARITGAAHPELIYDYYGFPPASYQIQYPAPGAPELAQQVQTLLGQAGIPASIDPLRGFDHGLFVPLKLLYPGADIPCIQLSLLNSLDPGAHIALGEALAPLRQHGVMIVGSGMSFHNLSALVWRGGNTSSAPSDAFDEWLANACCNPDLTPAQRCERLIRWRDAPHAGFCHPREEHLLPVHVCLGAALGTPAQHSYSAPLMGHRISALIWP